jgi:hypothetical protein
MRKCKKKKMERERKILEAIDIVFAFERWYERRLI